MFGNTQGFSTAGGSWNNGFQQQQQGNQQQIAYIWKQLYDALNQMLGQAVNANAVSQQAAQMISNMHNPAWVQQGQNPQNAQVVQTNLNNLTNYVENALRQQGMSLSNLQNAGSYIAQPLHRYVSEQIQRANNSLNMQQGQGGWQQGYTNQGNPFAQNGAAVGGNPFSMGVSANGGSVMTNANNPFGAQSNQPSFVAPPQGNRPTPQERQAQQAAAAPAQSQPQSPQGGFKASPRPSEKTSTGFGGSPVAETELFEVENAVNDPTLKAKLGGKGVTLTKLYHNQEGHRRAVAMTVKVNNLVSSEDAAREIARTALDENLSCLTVAQINYRTTRVLPFDKEHFVKLGKAFRSLDAWKSNEDYGSRLHKEFKDIIPVKQLDKFDRIIADEFNERSATFYRERFNLKQCLTIDSLTDLEDLIKIAGKAMNNDVVRAREFTNNTLVEILSSYFEGDLLEPTRKHEQAFIKSCGSYIFNGKDPVNALLDENKEHGEQWLKEFGHYHCLIIRNKTFYLTFDASKDVPNFDVLIDDKTNFDVTDIFSLMRVLENGGSETSVAFVVREGLIKNYLINGNTAARDETEFDLVWTKFGQEQRILLVKNGMKDLYDRRKTWSL